MNYSIECPICKNKFHVTSKELAENHSSFRCFACGTAPSPDIMTAYQNIGKTMADLYGHRDDEDKEKPIK